MRLVWILPTSHILKTLFHRGIYSVYIEGGALTTARFLREKTLDVLQLHISPMMLGSGVSIFFHSVTGFLVTSPFTKKVLEKRKILDKPIFIVPPALCLSPPIRRRKKERFKGLIVSNIIKGKGILKFLESLAQILAPSDLFDIQIAGRLDIDPEYAKACLELVEKKPEMKQSVHFLDPLNQDKLKELYEKSTLFLSPSKMETFGMAIREALAFGLPVFAYAAEYSRKLINPGKNVR